MVAHDDTVARAPAAGDAPPAAARGTGLVVVFARAVAGAALERTLFHAVGTHPIPVGAVVAAT